MNILRIGRYTHLKIIYTYIHELYVTLMFQLIYFPYSYNYCTVVSLYQYNHTHHQYHHAMTTMRQPCYFKCTCTEVMLGY